MKTNMTGSLYSRFLSLSRRQEIHTNKYIMLVLLMLPKKSVYDSLGIQMRSGKGSKSTENREVK